MAVSSYDVADVREKHVINIVASRRSVPRLTGIGSPHLGRFFLDIGVYCYRPPVGSYLSQENRIEDHTQSIFNCEKLPIVIPPNVLSAAFHSNLRKSKPAKISRSGHQCFFFPLVFLRAYKCWATT